MTRRTETDPLTLRLTVTLRHSLTAMAVQTHQADVTAVGSVPQVRRGRLLRRCYDAAERAILDVLEEVESGGREASGDADVGE